MSTDKDNCFLPLMAFWIVADFIGGCGEVAVFLYIGIFRCKFVELFI